MKGDRTMLFRIKSFKEQFQYIMDNSNLTKHDLNRYAGWVLYDNSEEGYEDFIYGRDDESYVELEKEWNGLQVVGDYKLEVFL